MDANLTQVGVGAVTLLLLKETFAFVKFFIDKSKEKKNGAPKVQVECLHADKIVDAFKGGFADTSKTLRLTEDIHRWHEKTDDTGAFVWYGDKVLLKEIKEAIDEQTAIQREAYYDMQSSLRKIAQNGNGKDK